MVVRGQPGCLRTNLEVTALDASGSYLLVVLVTRLWPGRSLTGRQISPKPSKSTCLRASKSGGPWLNIVLGPRLFRSPLTSRYATAVTLVTRVRALQAGEETITPLAARDIDEARRLMIEFRSWCVARKRPLPIELDRVDEHGFIRALSGAEVLEHAAADYPSEQRRPRIAQEAEVIDWREDSLAQLLAWWVVRREVLTVD